MDVPKRVAELFSEKPWKHDTKLQGTGQVQCVKCCLFSHYWQGKYVMEDKSDTCKFPDPIDITDLGKALECFRGLSPYYASPAIAKLSLNGEIDFEWAFTEATAEQIWEICILAKESEK